MGGKGGFKQKVVWCGECTSRSVYVDPVDEERLHNRNEFLQFGGGVIDMWDLFMRALKDMSTLSFNTHV
jgi:hypothetical protein